MRKFKCKLWMLFPFVFMAGYLGAQSDLPQTWEQALDLLDRNNKNACQAMRGHLEWPGEPLSTSPEAVQFLMAAAVRSQALEEQAWQQFTGKNSPDYLLLYLVHRSMTQDLLVKAVDCETQRRGKGRAYDPALS